MNHTLLSRNGPGMQGGLDFGNASQLRSESGCKKQLSGQGKPRVRGGYAGDTHKRRAVAFDTTGVELDTPFTPFTQSLSVSVRHNLK